MLVCHFQGREGVVKQIYRGTVFIYNEAEQENSGYFCCKSQNCEKFKVLGDACKEKVCMFVTYDYLIYPTPQILYQKNRIIFKKLEAFAKAFSLPSVQGSEQASVGFDDFPSSPKSPLSPKKPWQERDSSCMF